MISLKSFLLLPIFAPITITSFCYGDDWFDISNYAPADPVVQHSDAASVEDILAEPEKTPELQIPPELHPHHLFHDFLEAQRTIWTSPLHIRSRDLLWLGPFLGVCAITLKKDVEISESIEPSDHTLKVSRRISRIGSTPVDVAIAGSLYVVGKIGKHDHLAATGLHGLEALLQSAIVVQVMKLAAGRKRPDSGDSEGDFWKGGNSFPSGHSISAWTLAAVLSEEYPHNHWLRWGSYTAATAVAVTRVTGERHFVTDVLVGSTAGYLIGRMVVKQHQHQSASSGKAISSLTPYFDRNHRRYGMMISFQW